jgi:hypothetical protein
MPGEVFFVRSMTSIANPAPEPARAPEAFRVALAELVGFGMRVARMVAGSADTEIALAEAASAAGAAEGVSALATSLAEAMAADRAAAAAAEARATVVARVQAVAAAFAQVSRAIRRTVLLADGWTRAGPDGAGRMTGAPWPSGRLRAGSRTRLHATRMFAGRSG